MRRMIVAVCVLAGPAMVTATGCDRSSHAHAQRLAFVSLRSDPPGIHVSLSNGARLQRVSTSRAWVAAAPVWSPDGTKLAYTVETGPERWAIEVFDFATGAAHQVAKGMKLEDWSPDGAWLIATTLVDTDELLQGKKPPRRALQQLYAVPAGGDGRRVKLSDGKGWDYSPAVSPDGATVAFVTNRNDRVELRTVGIGGGAAKRLTQVRGDDVLGSPVWSPDGATIVFECRRGGAGAIQRLCRVASTGGEAPDLTAVWAASPRFSPDGTRIAFVAKDAAGTDQVWRMNADGSGAAPLTREGRNTHPAWSPDGARIAYVSDATGNPEVFVIAAEGGAPVNVSRDPARDGFPAWQPGAVPTRPRG